MSNDPIATVARDSTRYLDAAVRVLDPGVVIPEAESRGVESTARLARRGVPELCSLAVESIPANLSRDFREVILTEARCLLAVSDAVWRSEDPPVVRGVPIGSGNKGGQSAVLSTPGEVSGLVHDGSSIVGVSALFPLRTPGTGGTDTVWVDNLTGLPVGSWLTARSEFYDYAFHFIGGPWSGRTLSDSKVVSTALRHWTVFCDYEPYRRPVLSDEHGLLFRMKWGEAIHSADLDAQAQNFADIDGWIDGNA